MATALTIALPWLNPITWGPTSAMVQSLLSAASGAVLLVCWNAFGPRWGIQAMARALAMGWLLAAMLSAIAGLLQYFGLAGGDLSEWINPAPMGLAYANLRQRNQYATLTSLGMLALLYVHTTQAPWRRRTALYIAGMATAVVLLSLGNAASNSRTGALQWLCIAALAGLWSRRGARATVGWAVLGWVVYLIGSWVLPAALHSSTSAEVHGAIQRFQENEGCEDRSILWSNMLELIAERPWLGWGWNDLKYTHFMFPFRGARFCTLLDNAHNLPLHLAVALGLPAALAICGGALVVALKATPWRDANAGRQMAWAGLAVIAIHSMLEYPLWYGPFQVAALMAMVFLWRSRKPRTAPEPQSAAGMGGNMVIAACMLAMVAYTGWDYWRVGQLFIPEASRDPAYRENTLAKVEDSWLFQDTVRFARVTTTPVTPANAAKMYADALQTMHHSPEPLVITQLLESARLLGKDTLQVKRIRQQWRAIYGGKP